MQIVTVHGSKNKVVVSLGTGVFHPAVQNTIRITKPGKDKDTPMMVRKALVGLELDAIKFDKKLRGLPDGSYLVDVSILVEALRAADKKEAADELSSQDGNIYLFEPGIFEVK